jgi:hypothetical protein
MAHEVESRHIASVTTNGYIDGFAAVVDEKESAAELEASPERNAAKVKRILDACGENDLDALAALATSLGGLVEDDVRRTACRRSTHQNLQHLSRLTQLSRACSPWVRWHIVRRGRR